MLSTIVLQNAVRPPISAAVAFLPETMHSEQSSREKPRQVLQTWMSADNPYAELGYCLTPNSTVTIQGEREKKTSHKDKITQKVFKRKI